MILFRSLITFTAAMFFAGGVMAEDTSKIPDETSGTESIVKKAIESFEACDADGWLESRSENAMVFGIGWKSDAAGFINWYINENCSDGINPVKIGAYVIEGNLASLKWSNIATKEIGVDAIIFENGKITNQSVMIVKNTDFE